MKIFRFFYPSCILILYLISVYSNLTWAQGAWAFEKISPAIHRPGQTVEQSFRITEIPQLRSISGTISAISVQVIPTSSVQIDSYLCAESTALCVPVFNGRVYTKAFNDLSVATPLYVKHQVGQWQAGNSPTYIKVQLNIWWQ